MSTSSDSADEFVKMMLDGTEVVARLTGNMTKEIAVMLYAISKERNKHKAGKVKIDKMLKSKSNLKVFSIKKENLEDFKKGAKKYKIPYSAIYIKSKKNKEEVDTSMKDVENKEKVNTSEKGTKDNVNNSEKDKVNQGEIIDIIVREEDAVLINRIVEKYKLTTVKQSELDEILEKAEKEISTQTPKEKTEIQKEIQEKNTSQDLLNMLMKKENNKEKNENNNPSNIPVTEKKTPSENLLKANEKTDGSRREEKPSIRETLDTIKKQNEEKEKQKAEETKEVSKQGKADEIKHHQPKKKNRKKEQVRYEYNK